ncbi:MarR family transcriptional regulator [Saxibacter everestensis]|uniref:MarR family transcriptional regulator n=1 Tax=Saxibacter everestensis TaxID=2909229 RepID=A0ABY8QT17_9MICO|nr:MarR family transcriptional regulator [Brevibacteriaceae bacterium ZFBP1038]
MKADKMPRTSPSPRQYRRYLAAITLFHQSAADSAGLSGTDYQASNLLDIDGPMSSGELARRLGLTTGATTRLVDRLVRSGIAERVEDSADRRRALVRHTGKLPTGLAETLDLVREPIGRALDALTPEQREGVSKYLETATGAYSDAARVIGTD